MQTIGIVYNCSKQACADCAQQISSYLSEQKKTVYTIDQKTPAETLDSLDCIISIGGDGSLLHIAALLCGRSIPVLGVNAGSLGFLTSVKEDEVFNELQSILAGNYRIEERVMLCATIGTGKKGEKETFHVLNDVVIAREGLTRFLDTTVTIDGTTLVEYGGDGVIIATPTGSTAYSLSAGGPLLYPTLHDIVITPLCSHSLKSKPLVVPATSTVTVTISCEQDDDDACIVLDGQEKRTIASHTVITVQKSNYIFRLITSSQRNYFDVVHEKL